MSQVTTDRLIGVSFTQRMAKIKVSDQLLKFGTLALLLTGLGILLLIPVFIAREALPLLLQGNIFPFLMFDSWAPLLKPPTLGIVHAWISTVLVVALALAFAIPIGFGIGIFLSEVAPPLIKALLQPCLELLAGIPSVVYGFFGYMTICVWLERIFDLATGESILAAGLILAIMVLPFIAVTSAEAFRMVRRDLVEVAYSLGVSRFYTVRKIIIPEAAPGMFAAVALGLARAIGETFAVLMIAGNSTAIPTSLLARGQPLTALLATEMGEAEIGSAKYQALFAAGLILVAVVCVVNLLVWKLKGKLLHEG